MAFSQEGEVDVLRAEVAELKRQKEGLLVALHG